MRRNFKFVIGLLVFLFVGSVSGQEIWPSKKGNLKIDPIRHASLVLEWNHLTIYVDPVGDPELYKKFPAPDFVLITHAHGDHLSNTTLKGIKATEAQFIVSEDVAKHLDSLFKGHTHILNNGESIKIGGLAVDCVPAYNYPITENAFHPKGVGNGYILNLADLRIYISGDTGNIPEMKEIKGVDIAFLCMNLPYTMNVEDAAKACLAIQPKVIYPYHFKGKPGFSDLGKFKDLVKKGNPKIEVRILDWYPQ
jgi:L-ascorbate metabolism protein UlaG (beta-lactamase superfamily)